MDASQTTATRKMRSRYFDYLDRNCSINKGTNTTRPLVSGVPPGAGGYTDAYLEIVKAPTVVSAAEAAAVCPAPTPNPPPPGDNFTFAIRATFDGSPNHFYRFFNKETGLWSDLINSGLASVDYTLENNSNQSKYFVFLYSNSTNYVAQFITPDGQLLRSVTITKGDRYNFTAYDNVIAMSFSYVDSTSRLVVYNIDTDTYNEQLVSNADSVDNISRIDGIVLFFVDSNTDNNFRVYRHLASTASFEQVFVCTDYVYSSRFNSGNIVIVHGNTGDNFYQTIDMLFADGTQGSYSLPANTYDSSDINRFGLNGQHAAIGLVNVITDADDIYVMRNTLPLTPIVRAFLYNPFNEYFNDGDTGADLTSANNNYAVRMYYPKFINNIGDGGYDMFDNGNYIDIDGTYNSGAASFSVTEGVYGSAEKTAGAYGYAIGDRDTQPHMTFAHTNDGRIQIRAHGNLGSDGNGDPTNYNAIGGPDATYTCSNGRNGKYWLNVNRDNNDDDPTLGELWFTIEVPSWGSTTLLLGDTRHTSSDPDYDHYVDVSGANFLFCKALLASRPETTITQAEVVNFLTAYVQNISLPASYAALDLSGVVSWHNTNGRTYATNNITNYFEYYYDGDDNESDLFYRHQYSILLDGDASFRNETIEYAGSRVLFTKTSAHVIAHTGSSCKIRNYLASGNTDTLFQTGTIPGDFTSFSRTTLSENIFFVMTKETEGTTYHTIYANASGVILHEDTSSDSTSRGGDTNTCVAIQNSTNSVTVYRPDSSTAVTGSFGQGDSPYPDFANGIIYLTRSDADPNNFAIVSDSGVNILSIPGDLDNRYTYFGGPAFFVHIFSNPVRMVGVTTAGVVTTYNSEENWNIESYYFTDECYLLIASDPSNNVRHLIVYNSAKNRISSFEEAAAYNSYSYTKNYKYDD